MNQQWYFLSEKSPIVKRKNKKERTIDLTVSSSPGFLNYPPIYLSSQPLFVEFVLFINCWPWVLTRKWLLRSKKLFKETSNFRVKVNKNYFARSTSLCISLFQRSYLWPFSWNIVRWAVYLITVLRLGIVWFLATALWVGERFELTSGLFLSTHNLASLDTFAAGLRTGTPSRHIPTKGELNTRWYSKTK